MARPLSETMVKLQKNNSAWLIYSNVPMSTTKSCPKRALLELIDSKTLRIVSSPSKGLKGFKVTCGTKDGIYTYWTLSGNRLVTYYLSLAGVTPRKFNREILKASIKLPILSREPLTVSVEPLIKFLEEKTGASITPPPEDFPLVLLPRQKTPPEEANSWTLYVYYLQRRRHGEVLAYLRIPDSVVSQLEPLNSSKTPTSIVIDLPPQSGTFQEEVTIIFNRIPKTVYETKTISVSPLFSGSLKILSKFAKASQTPKLRLKLNIKPLKIGKNKIVLNYGEIIEELMKAIRQEYPSQKASH